MLFNDSNGDILYYSLILTKSNASDEKSYGLWSGTTATSDVITRPFWNPFKGIRN